MKFDLSIHCKRLGEIPLGAQDTNTVSVIKQVIQRVTEIPMDKQTLTLDDTVLEDSRKLTEYGITKESTLLLILPLGIPELIAVRITLPGGKFIRLWVDEKATVESLKERLLLLRDWPVGGYELEADGVLLRDSHMLMAWGVKNGSVLKVKPYADGHLK
ncbi:unnamed protein product [Dibothriocephalus latus]|uniref:Ubiquitin-like domain-containing protein n=1 Tax=Dibothriocephalus latus TaxID=60516 RepID=A0A3P7NZZ4_DIBLA|nr:unnamed protein product [Dibothriocephalus latus]